MVLPAPGAPTRRRAQPESLCDLISPRSQGTLIMSVLSMMRLTKTIAWHDTGSGLDFSSKSFNEHSNRSILGDLSTTWDFVGLCAVGVNS